MKKIFFVFCIASIILYGIITRINMYEVRRGFSGEDTFSLLNTSRAITQFKYPPTEKRLPLYPLLLTPVAHNPIIAIEYGKIINIIFGSLLLLLVAIFTYQLSKSYFASTIATALISLNVSLTLISARALTDALFLLLNTLNLLFAYYYLKKLDSQKYAIIFGLLLGLSAMTRYEGFIVAMILLGTYIFSFKKHRKNIVIAGLVFGIVVSPWFIKNTIQYKNPFFSPYLKDAEYGIKDESNFKEKLVNGVKTLPVLFFKYDRESIQDLNGLVNSDSPIRWKLYLLRTNILPRMSVVILAYLTIIFMCIGLYALYKKSKVYGLSYGLTIIVLYILAMFIWLRLIARFYNSQLPLMAILIGIGIATITKKLKGIWKIFFVVLILYSFYFMFFSLQREMTDRLKSEVIDTNDNAIYLQSLIYLHKTHKKVITNINDHNVIPFYINDVEYVKSTNPITSCNVSNCLYYFESKSAHITQDDELGRIIKRYYLKSKQSYLIIYGGRN